jgi:hypothetical protein
MTRAACCSCLLIATKRIVGRVTASQNAAAAAASFFPRLTLGFDVVRRHKAGLLAECLSRSTRTTSSRYHPPSVAITEFAFACCRLRANSRIRSYTRNDTILVRFQTLKFAHLRICEVHARVIRFCGFGSLTKRW